MPTKIESRFVDFRAIKAMVSMEQVLAHYGVLDRFKRSQDSLSGPCPIHNGTNPTQFRVSVSKNIWNCFSDCKCGGSVIDFVGQMERTSLGRAAQLLVEWFHLEGTACTPSKEQLAQRRPEKAPVDTAKPAKPPESHNGASAPVSSPPEKPAKEPGGFNRPLGFHLELDPGHPYLKERGLDPDTIDEFGLGFCPKGVMAQRIAIPIHNSKGELVGYAGRWPGDPPEDRPKYRLPDGFKKALEIYRFAQAMREDPNQPLVIVEGYFDAMKLWQIGVRRCVALMGSSLSEAQEKLLVSVLTSTSRVVVMFDEDEAGREGRADIVKRLSPYAYVRLASFAEEGFEAKNLTAEEAQKMGVLLP